MMVVANCEDLERVSLRSIEKSGRVLYAFTEFYLPFYGLGDAYLFRHYATFACISALVYDFDEAAENHAATDPLAGLAPLRKYLGALSLDSPEVLNQLANAHAYYEHERKSRQVAIPWCDIIDATERRSFDFRIMHVALSALLGESLLPAAVSWYRDFEILMEVEDDLQSIDSDERAGTFNIYCLARRSCGDSAAQLVDDYRCQKEEQISRKLMAFSSQEQSRLSQVFSKYRQIVLRPQLPSCP